MWRAAESNYGRTRISLKEGIDDIRRTVRTGLGPL
jgi:hypothetical protein